MQTNRRSFLKGIGGLAAASAVGGCASSKFGFNCGCKTYQGEKLKFGIIGAGGKGWTDWRNMFWHGELPVAICDVDSTLIDKALAEIRSKGFKTDSIRTYTDFRKMIDDQSKLRMDFVTVSTPDHMHAYPALWAMNMGKYVYVQKPLAHSFEECEMLAAKAKETGLVCQMGNQGHPGVLRYKALMDELNNPWGEIESIESWSDRPDYIGGDGKKRVIWKQGMREYAAVQPYAHGYNDKTWDIWCGPAANHGYSDAYAPCRWRGWWEYGCGPIGDMAVHNADPAFWLFNLGLPVAIQGDTCGFGPATVAFPFQSIIRMRFAPQPLFPKGVTLTWRDGGLLPSVTPDMNPSWKPGSNGLVIVGSKATTAATSHAAAPAVIAAGKTAWGDAARELKSSFNKVLKEVKTPNHYREWVEACVAGTPEACGSKFSYAAPLTEALLLGCLSLRFPGRGLLFDTKAKRFTNCAQANELLKAPMRGGWNLAALAAKPWWKFW